MDNVTIEDVNKAIAEGKGIDYLIDELGLLYSSYSEIFVDVDADGKEVEITLGVTRVFFDGEVVCQEILS